MAYEKTRKNGKNPAQPLAVQRDVDLTDFKVETIARELDRRKRAQKVAESAVVPDEIAALGERAAGIWLRLWESRASDFWTATQLECLRRLVHIEIKVDAIEDLLHSTDDFIINGGGSLVTHPKYTLYSLMMTRRRNLMASLGLNGNTERLAGMSILNVNRAIDHDAFGNVVQQDDASEGAGLLAGNLIEGQPGG